MNRLAYFHILLEKNGKLDSKIFPKASSDIFIRHTNGFLPFVAIYEILGARVVSEVDKKAQPKKKNKKKDRGKWSYDLEPPSPRPILKFTNVEAAEKLKTFKGRRDFKIEFRSTQSVLYHLGELIRQQLSSGNSEHKKFQ